MLKNTSLISKPGLLLFATLALAQTQCGPARFAEYSGAPDPQQSSSKPQPTPAPGDNSSGNVGANPGTNPGAQPGTKPGTQTREYDTRALIYREKLQPLDMTWVIDNSSSMTTEAAHVRKNFVSFVNSVKAESDLRVALVSQAGTTGTNVKMPFQGANYLQIDRYVWSTDSLEILAATFCPVVPTANTVCKQLRDGARTKTLGTIAGKLKPFLRANSKKAFVFVTDDESRVTAEKFLRAFGEMYPGEQPYIYGFVGFANNQSPCAEKPGAQYVALSQVTSGAVFNVCDDDWTPAFKTLASQISRLVAVPVPVPEDLVTGEQITSVELNGTTVDKAHYTLLPEGLVFAPEIAKGLNEVRIRVRYEVGAAN